MAGRLGRIVETIVRYSQGVARNGAGVNAWLSLVLLVTVVAMHDFGWSVDGFKRAVMVVTILHCVVELNVFVWKIIDVIRDEKESLRRFMGIGVAAFHLWKAVKESAKDSTDPTQLQPATAFSGDCSCPTQTLIHLPVAVILYVILMDHHNPTIVEIHYRIIVLMSNLRSRPIREYRSVDF